MASDGGLLQKRVSRGWGKVLQALHKGTPVRELHVSITNGCDTVGSCLIRLYRQHAAEWEIFSRRTALAHYLQAHYLQAA